MIQGKIFDFVSPIVILSISLFIARMSRHCKKILRRSGYPSSCFSSIFKDMSNMRRLASETTDKRLKRKYKFFFYSLVLSFPALFLVAILLLALTQ